MTNIKTPTEIKAQAIKDTLRRFEASRKRAVLGVDLSDDDPRIPEFFRRGELCPYDGVPALTGYFGE
jgi:hypothetical protein